MDTSRFSRPCLHHSTNRQPTARSLPSGVLGLVRSFLAHGLLPGIPVEFDAGVTPSVLLTDSGTFWLYGRIFGGEDCSDMECYFSKCNLVQGNNMQLEQHTLPPGFSCPKSEPQPRSFTHFWHRNPELNEACLPVGGVRPVQLLRPGHGMG